MHLLILGGTVFLGRHLAQAALDAGHRVTLFHRGKHNPDLFPQAERILGDRESDADLARLVADGRTYDAVVDTCGYVPRLVHKSASALKGHVGLYCFISSISVYSDMSLAYADEDAPTGVLEDTTVEEITGETYGPLKVLCENAVREMYSTGRSLIIRPGLIVGPHDPSDRFTYWPRRIAEGGTILAPDRPEVPVQFIDVRDLVEWNLRLLTKGVTGVFNATGPDYPLTMGAFLDDCRRACASDAGLVWVPEGFLREQNVAEWSDLPLWVSDRESPGFSTTGIQRAIGSGLTFRPAEETVRDTLAWARTLSADYPWKAGLTREREAEVLAAWENS